MAFRRFSLQDGRENRSFLNFAKKPSALYIYPVMKEKFTIILFYKYTKVEKPEALCAWHKDLLSKLGMKGRVLIANEGINGTLEGTDENVHVYIQALRSIDPETGMGNWSDIEVKESAGTGNAFPKLKVKVRKEIVALGLRDEDFDPNVITGVRLKPTELKEWYEKGKDFVVVDMRNDFEFAVGRFKNSINPPMEYFRDLPKALPSLEHLKDKTVLTVCTGGVRCEKASGYLKKKGFKDVYQLHGGMHKYMEQYPGEDFLGTLYTFDNRIVMDFGGNREVIGKCQECKNSCETFTHCGRGECHKHLICCEDCLNRKGRIFCTMKCKIKFLINKLLGKETLVPVKIENS